jgi:hypothetical protein
MDMDLVHRSREDRWETVQEAEIEYDVAIGQIGCEVRIECDAEIVDDHENSWANLCSMHEEVDAVEAEDIDDIDVVGSTKDIDNNEAAAEGREAFVVGVQEEKAQMKL